MTTQNNNNNNFNANNGLMNITLEVPIETITQLMTSIEECKSDTRKIWSELSYVKKDVHDLRLDIQRLISGNSSSSSSNRRR